MTSKNRLTFTMKRVNSFILRILFALEMFVYVEPYCFWHVLKCMGAFCGQHFDSVKSLSAIFSLHLCTFPDNSSGEQREASYRHPALLCTRWKSAEASHCYYFVFFLQL